MYDFDKIINRKEYNSIKWNAMGKNGLKSDDLLPFWIADMDFLCPPKVVKRISEKAEHGVYGYTMVEEDYYNLPINWIKRRTGYSIDKGTLLATPGMLLSLGFTLKLFTEENDSVLVNTPSYPPFLDMVRKAKLNLIENPLKIKNGKYVIDFDLFERDLIKHSVKWYILSSPHNPTGRLWSKDELTEIGNICLRNNVRIVNDEAWRDLVLDGKRTLSLPAISKKFEDICITIFSPTKTFNIAGLQTSFVSLPRVEEYKKFKSELMFLHLNNTSYFAHGAVEEAYGASEEWLEDLLVYLTSNRNYVIDFISENMPKVKFIKPESTYLLWLDFREYGIKNIHEFFQDKCKLFLSNGADFGNGGVGFLRFNFACPRVMLEKALKIMSEELNKI